MTHVVRRPIGALSVCLAVALAGCAARIEVTRLGSADPSQAFFELRGHQLSRLHEQAARLCPAGMTVLRQAERAQAADPGAGLPAAAVITVLDVLAPADQDRSQLLVQCPAVAVQAKPAAVSAAASGSAG